MLGTSALRASEGFSKLLPSSVVVVAYGLAFFLMSQVLKTLPLGFTYAVWSGVGTSLTALIGWWYFRDSLNAMALGGIALIIVGVVVLQLSGSARH